MPVSAGAEGDRYVITIIKYLSTNPDRKWANNYEVRAKAAIAEADLTALGLKLVDFEQALAFAAVQFDRLRISTWEPDSTPYDPDAFISLPLAASGSRSEVGTEKVALNVCLDVGRVPATGRFGHIFLRGSLAENEISAPAGKYVLTDPSAINTLVATAVTDADLADTLAGDDPALEIVMISSDGSQTRRVLSFQRRGVSVVPFNHGWFNRTSP